MGRNHGFPLNFVHYVYINLASLRETDKTLGAMQEAMRNDGIKSKGVDVQGLGLDGEGRAGKGKGSE